MSQITPVSILTGYLGSGKTTLLNRLLQAPDMQDTAVLINEYGEIAIDHLLVRESSDNITVLSNGCVCCSVSGDMVKALRDLYFKRANGEVPNFQRVIIETTGLADPAPIMHTLIEMPLVAARYALSGIITTIDATHGMTQLDSEAESVKQAAVADRIVMTKTDLASAEIMAALRERMMRLNPAATIIESTMGKVDAAQLFDTGLYQVKQKSTDVANWLRAEMYRPVIKKPPTSSAKHDERIASFCVRYESPIVWEELINVIEMIQSMRGDQLLRMKGIVNVAGEKNPRVLHAVQHTIYPAATLSAWPDADHSTKLVFIVKDLNPTFIDECLKTYIQQGVSSKNAANAAPMLVS